MSLFGNLVRTDGTTKSDLDFRELPIFSYKNLVDKEEIGVGAFAVVFTAKLPDKSKVVVKKLISADEETKKSLIKEARLLQNLRHANVVEFKGICTDQLSLLLEYAYFDFSPFGCDIQTHSLAEFLAVCEQSSCDGMNVAVFTHAAFDVASGLKYLHQNNIAHRDLKPANILVSNRHYHHLSDQEKIKQIISIKPLVCKLADFGESRSTDIQTQNILKSRTNRVDRGK